MKDLKYIEINDDDASEYGVVIDWEERSVAQVNWYLHWHRNKKIKYWLRWKWCCLKDWIRSKQ